MKDPYFSQRTSVVNLSKALLETGLVVRTWGNVSQRTEGNSFVITPSGRPYETMIESDLAIIDEEGKNTGPFKPSSEFPMHKLCFELRPAANSVAHTHQRYASALSLAGRDIELTEDEAKAIGQTHIYTARYGLPSTKKLHTNVKKTLEDHPDAMVILLEAHGVFLCGNTATESLQLAQHVEAASRRVYQEITGSDLRDREVAPTDVVASSCTRSDNQLSMTFLRADGTELTTVPADVRSLHEEIYTARKDVSAIRVCVDSEVDTVAAQVAAGTELRPYLDDFAQIVGIKAGSSVRGSNVVFRDGLALCLGKDSPDAHAVETVLKKNARAALVAQACGSTPIAEWECRLMNFIYKVKYSKQAG